MADGSVIIDTSIDTSGIQDAEKTISKSFKRIGKNLKEAFGISPVDKAAKNVQKMQEKYNSATAAAERQKEAVMHLKNELSELQSQQMGQANYQEPEAAKPLIKQAEKLKFELDEAKQKLKEYNDGTASSANKHEEWNQKVAKLSDAYDKVLSKIEQIENKSEAGIQSKIAATSKQILIAEQRYDALNGKSLVAKKNLISAMDSKKIAPVTGAVSRASKAVGVFGTRIASLIKSALIFSVLTKVLTKLRELFASMLKSNTEFANSWSKVKGNLLTAFQPIYEYALPAVMALMEALEKVTAAMASFSAKLFGKSVSEMQSNAKALYNQANATKAVGAAAEDAKRSLAGFDEINQLSDNSSSSGSSSSSSVAPSFDGEIGDTSKLDKIASYGTTLAGIGLLLVGISTVNIGAIAAGVVLLAIGFELGESTGAFEDTPPWVNQIITWGGMIVGVALLLVGIAQVNIPMILAGVAAIGVSIAYGVKSGAFEDFFAVISEFLSSVRSKVSEWWSGVKAWFDENVMPIFTKEYWQEKFDKIKESVTKWFDSTRTSLSEWWSGVKAWFDENVMPIFTKEYWQEKFDKIKESVTKWFDSTRTSLSEWWSGVKTWFDENIMPIFTKEYWQKKFEKISESITNFKNKAQTKFSEIWNSIEQTFSNIGSWFGQKFSSAWQSIQNAFSGVGSFFSNVWTTIKSKFTDIGQKIGDSMSGAVKKAINAILQTAENALNTPIRAINKAIDVINKIPGVSVGYVSTVSLPRLATGTVVPANYGEFAAILGDNRREPEIVSPLSTMKQALKEALAESGGKNISITIPIVLSGKVIGETSVEYINGVIRQTGKSPVKQGA